MQLIREIDIAGGLPLIPAGRRLRRYWPILAYHSVSNLRRDGLSLSPHEFESHLRFLRSEGYQSASVGDLLDALASDEIASERRAVITFDDGYVDNFENAFPLLQQYGYSSVFFVVTEVTGTNRIHSFDRKRLSWGLGPERSFRVMNWGHLRELAAHGMEIGSHTHTHTEFTPGVASSVVEAEIRESTVALEQKLGARVKLFSYPRGTVDARAFPLLEAAGYQAALVTPPLNDRLPETRFTLKRVGVYRSNPWKFRTKISPLFFSLRQKGIFRLVSRAGLD